MTISTTTLALALAALAIGTLVTLTVASILYTRLRERMKAKDETDRQLLAALSDLASSDDRAKAMDNILFNHNREMISAQTHQVKSFPSELAAIREAQDGAIDSIAQCDARVADVRSRLEDLGNHAASGDDLDQLRGALDALQTSTTQQAIQAAQGATELRALVAATAKTVESLTQAFAQVSKAQQELNQRNAALLKDIHGKIREDYA